MTRFRASKPSPKSANTCAEAAVSASVPRSCCFPRNCSTTRVAAPFGWARWWRSSTPQRWFTMTSSTKPRPGAGRPAANTQWGNSKCVLAGDWLYMQAFKVAVQERNFRILDTLIELTQQMVEGELLQMEKLGKLISLDEHFNLIFRKTACLFSVCMRMGAILGGATPEQEESLAQYGRDLGMAFQIVDDVLDLTASENVLGKPVASDLREGKVTMAVIHALERCTPAERKSIETVLRERAFDGVTHREIIAILERYGSLEAANARAMQYATLARNAICSFPDSEIKRALLWAPEFVVAREK